MTQIWGEPGYYKFLIRSRQEQTDCDHFARQSRSRWGGFLAGWPEDIIEQLKAPSHSVCVSQAVFLTIRSTQLMFLHLRSFATPGNYRT